MRLAVYLVLISTLISGCTGLSFGENNPGQDTLLEYGSIAVDPRTDTAFVIHRVFKRGAKDSAPSAKILAAVHPDQQKARVIGDFVDYQNLHILFPEGSVLLIAEDQNGYEHLTVLDPITLQVLQTREPSVPYHETRLSPSGRFLVANGKARYVPLHVTDSRTLESVEFQHGGELHEAMWMSQSDTLVAIVFHDIYIGSEFPRARLLAWHFGDTNPAGPLPVPIEEGWPEEVVDVSFDHVGLDYSLFSSTWIGVCPQDRHVVFPVQSRVDDPDDPGTNIWISQLLVLDLTSGQVRTHNNARGPVGFSPDGSTIVSYRVTDVDGQGSRPQVLLVDVETLDEEVLDLPYDSDFQYFVTSEGNFLVIAPSSILDDGSLILLDFDTGETKILPGPGVHLDEFVSRTGHGELWLIDNGPYPTGWRGVFRVDLYAEVVEAVELEWAPEHINILHERDLLVLDRPQDHQLLFFEPEQRSVVHAVGLPDSAGD